MASTYSSRTCLYSLELLVFANFWYSRQGLLAWISVINSQDEYWYPVADHRVCQLNTESGDLATPRGPLKNINAREYHMKRRTWKTKLKRQSLTHHWTRKIPLHVGMAHFVHSEFWTRDDCQTLGSRDGMDNLEWHIASLCCCPWCFRWLLRVYSSLIWLLVLTGTALSKRRRNHFSFH